MGITLDKHFDHTKAERGVEKSWIDSGYFTAGRNEEELAKPRFSMIVPPPNVTGKLHIGHAKDNVEQDIIARYKRLSGYDVLFLPAMDHAGIATQAKVEEKLRSEGIDKYELGREGFLEKAWEWKDEYAASIHAQWEAMGLSMDFSRERFTLDDGMQRAVAHVFKCLYDKGLIYQGERIINWDPVLKTALSNIEVVHRDIPGKFYYFKYRLKSDPSFYLTVATTRPETMFGDTALVYNPKDPRYAKYDGMEFINPANGASLPLIADKYVDIEFGTGVMKCTPAHDPNDFLIGQRHNLEMPVIMNPDATMNERCGKYAGLDRFTCRQLLVRDIEAADNLIRVEDIVHNVGHSERTDAIIEPYLCKQWFVRMKPLAEAVDRIQKSPARTKFFPARFSKTFQRWLDTTEDWCISRQLWWGHRIPVYTSRETGEVVCSETPMDPSVWEQDPDVLDTWFSSGLAPFGFMGWPDDDSLMKRYYPLDVMVTGYDIIFFWVARMAFDAVEFTGEMPFRDVVLHGLIRDSQGRKMSKSLGNGIDPFDIIDRYGCDAMRWALSSQGAPGLDLNIGESNFKSAAEFVNKVWNAARFVLAQLPEDFVPGTIEVKDLSFTSTWLLSRLSRALRSYTRNMDKYEQGQAARYLSDFIWDDLCGTYLEWSKVEIARADEDGKKVIYNVLCTALKAVLTMLFPFCPFISEAVYKRLPGHLNSLFEERIPEPLTGLSTAKVARGNRLKDAVAYVRNFKSENGLAPNEPVDIKLACSPEEFRQISPLLSRFAFARSISRSPSCPGMRFFSSLGVLVDAPDSEVLKRKIADRIAKLQSEIARGEKLLSNPNFVSRANPKVVEEERKKLESNRAELARYTQG